MSKTYRFSLSFQKEKGKRIFFALPHTNHYQTISHLAIHPHNYSVIEDNRWSNRILTQRLDSRKKITISFRATPRAIQDFVNSQFSVNDYRSKPPQPNRFINGRDEKIQNLATKVVGKERNLVTILKKTYDLTLDYLHYGKPIKGLYDYKQALEQRVTDCGGFSTFLASLLQSFNIPSRLVVGFIINHNLFHNLFPDYLLLTTDYLLMHVWLEVLLPDKTWFPMDPSIEWKRKKQLTKRLGGFGFIPADRLITSFDCDHTIIIDNKTFTIDILQDAIYFND